MPRPNVGIGGSALVDLDRDGDFDFVVVNRGDSKLYWFGQGSKTDWVRHLIGDLVLAQLGCTILDVDADDRPDVIVGGYWFEITENRRFQYDASIPEHVQG
jgi:hypothetical protein